MTGAPEIMPLRVQAVRYEADGVLSYELIRPDGATLPPFVAGAHIDLHLPNGLIRSYSVSSDQQDLSRYVIGVSRDADSRGGSIWIHENVRPGDLVQATGPTNDFPLREDAERSVLIAGGIGITPILAMVRRLRVLERDWTLHYAVQSRDRAAFLEELARLAADRLRLHADDEHGGSPPDIAQIVAEAPAGSHLYCCGPTPMLAAFEEAAAEIPADRRHVEHFSNDIEPADGGFEVELIESGITIKVGKGESILQALTDAGVDAPFSCSEGICGTCETRVIAGVPDHRDLVLSDQEKETGDVLMICCSGSKTARLVLER
jgi:ferredoxin-NADP reductase